MNKTYAFNWRQSSAHIWFLTTFLKPRPNDDHFQGVDWWRALGEPPIRAIERFQVQGDLTHAPFAVQLDGQFARKQLSEMCREQGLPVSGKKDELIARLVQADALPVDEIAGNVIYQCTDVGRTLAEQYLADPEGVMQLNDGLPLQPDNAGEQLSRAELMRILRWLLLEGIVLGVVGNAVYDLLKELAAEAGQKIGELLPDIRPVKDEAATWLTPALKIEWCYVLAGSFLMGSKKNDPQAWDDEKPQHRVYLPAFYIAKFPVTNAQYQAFVRAVGHRTPYYWDINRFPGGQANHPVYGLYWRDAVAFCEWAARVTRRPIRLPTEAEWEKAARGTNGRIYPWGNQWDTSRCNAENKDKGTTPVDRYPRGRSPYGVYDMAGNVWEWTSTIYKDYPYREGDGRENMQETSVLRVVRGGSWWSNSRSARAAARRRRYDLRRSYGFRVCVAAPFS